MRRLVKSFGSLLLFALIFVVAQAGVSLLVGVFGFGFIDESGITDFGFMAVYLMSMLLVLMLVTFEERLCFGSVRRVEHSRRGFDPIGLLLGVVLLIAISVVMQPLGDLMPVDERSFPDGGWTLFSVVVLAPILEELIFRVRLYNILSRSLSPLMSASLSALMFGLVHLEPIVILEGFVVGIVLSYFYIQKRSIVAPILLHACNNAIAYMLHFISYREESLVDMLDDNLPYYVVYGVSCVVVMVAAVVILRKFIKERKALRSDVAEEVPHEDPEPSDEVEDQ